jgi:hypothetical protein
VRTKVSSPALARASLGEDVVFAGALGGTIPLFQKISTSEFGRARSLLELEFQTPGRFLQMIERGAEIFSNPFALLWMGIAVTSTLVMQFSYRRDEAIRVIPAFSSNYLPVPVIGGLLAFGDRLHVLQWAGVALIVGGVLLLTLKCRAAAVDGAGGTAAVSPARRAAGGE